VSAAASRTASRIRSNAAWWRSLALTMQTASSVTTVTGPARHARHRRRHSRLSDETGTPARARRRPPPHVHPPAGSRAGPDAAVVCGPRTSETGPSTGAVGAASLPRLKKAAAKEPRGATGGASDDVKRSFVDGQGYTGAAGGSLRAAAKAAKAAAPPTCRTKPATMAAARHRRRTARSRATTAGLASSTTTGKVTTTP